LSPPAEFRWGGRFFTKGLPYFLSLYVGPLSLALAAAGVPALPRPQRWMLLGAAALGVWYALGERAGLASLLAHLPGLRTFRFPVRPLSLPPRVTAIVAGHGADGLAGGEGWSRFGRVAAVAGGVAGVVAAAAFHPAFVAWLAAIEPAFAPRVRQIL